MYEDKLEDADADEDGLINFEEFLGSYARWGGGGDEWGGWGVKKGMSSDCGRDWGAAMVGPHPGVQGFLAMSWGWWRCNGAAG